MFERGISPEKVKTAIDNGKIIQEYPEDKPFPSFLMLGYAGSQAIHIVGAIEPQEKDFLVITVYYPDLEIWENDFTRRRKK